MRSAQVNARSNQRVNSARPVQSQQPARARCVSLQQGFLWWPHTAVALALINGEFFWDEDPLADLENVKLRGCPEFCVNGARVKSWASSLQTG